MKIQLSVLAVAMLTACSGGESDRQDPDPGINTPLTDATEQSAEDTTVSKEVDQLHMVMLDCGTINISDLDDFSSAGDYAGLSDTFTNTCWLIRHPDGNLMWDLGLPSAIAGNGPLENGIYALTMKQPLSEQLVPLGLLASDIDYISISHSHFDHTGQVDQFQTAKWLVHADEYAAMFPTPDGGTAEPSEESDAGTSTQFIGFTELERLEFTDVYDVFEDGSVLIIPTPGHTPGHTSLLVTLPESGPMLLTGDLYHRDESRELRRVPRFNTDEAATLASMDAFEALAIETGARIVIQHEPRSIADLPQAPDSIR